MTQNVGTKSAFMSIFFLTGYHNYEGYEVWKWEGHEDQDSDWDNHKKT